MALDSGSALEGCVARFATLDPADERVSDGEKHDLDERLVEVADHDVFHEVDAGDDARKGDRAKDDGVGEFSDHGRTDESRPQSPLFGALLHFHEHPGIEELANQEPAHACKDDSWHETEYRFECLLVSPAIKGRRELHDPEGECGQDREGEAEEDRASSGAQPVDLTEDVADNVDQREEERSAVNDQVADNGQVKEPNWLDCRNVADQKQPDKRSDQDRIHRSIWCREVSPIIEMCVRRD